MRRSSRSLPVQFAFAFACASTLACTGRPDPEAPAEPATCSSTGLEVGMCAPDFSLLDRDSEPFTLRAQRGKVALVDISAIW